MKHQLSRRFAPFVDIARTGWQNRDQLPFAWRILNNGVCDGCALGTSGMKDWTIDGVHLCWIRLNLLRLNTMPAFDPANLPSLNELMSMPEKALRELGRIPVPLLRRQGENDFREVDWETAISLVSAKIKTSEPERLAFYIVSRGTTNETYYATQKAIRYIGSNHVDNSARICHAPSTTGLKTSVGFAATTCSYKDMIGSDLVVFFGSNAANNQPVVMKYLHEAKKKGTKVAVVNTFKEPGMMRYWVPSNVRSALIGTQIADHFVQVGSGGDIAFMNGVIKHLIENKWLAQDFIDQKTSRWKELEAKLAEQSFEYLEQASGVSKEDMLAFAEMYARCKSAIFVWSMGITMHKFGIANVQSIANLALARGMIGRPHCGLMPIRGHSGVQGGAEVGCVPNLFPGARAINADTAAEMAQLWGFPVPPERGYYVADMIDAAMREELDLLYCVGSNLFSVLPDSNYVRQAIEKVPLRVHHDIVLNPQMFLDSPEAVLILPATTRYEMAGGNTETTTERRIIFSPEIPGRRIPGARDEWRVLQDIARESKPGSAHLLNFNTTAEIREEIAKVVPLYDGIQNLKVKGDNFQWGGSRLGADGRFGTADGKAYFTVLNPPNQKIPEGKFFLSSRRGKQFNSMTFGENDALGGGKRNSVVMAKDDMEALGLATGDPVLIKSPSGELQGTVKAGEIKERMVMMYWPEANVLIPRGETDPLCGIPAFRDTFVEIVPVD